MATLSQSFAERVQEIDAYLDLLDALERQTQLGPPRIGGGTITVQQQKILYSAVYLQLYNLVEATVCWCLEAVCEASANGGWLPKDLTAELRREWVRTTARTHVELNCDNRWQETVDFCERLISSLPVVHWKIERRSAGSWDDKQIENMTTRLGCRVRVAGTTLTNIKRKVRNDKTALELVRDFRNRLAHGSLSFTECGDGVTVADLRNIKDWTAKYLHEVVESFERYISQFEFLNSVARQAAGGTT